MNYPIVGPQVGIAIIDEKGHIESFQGEIDLREFIDWEKVRASKFSIVSVIQPGEDEGDAEYINRLQHWCSQYKQRADFVAFLLRNRGNW